MKAQFSVLDVCVTYRDHVVAGLEDLEAGLVHQVGHLAVKRTHINRLALAPQVAVVVHADGAGGR